MRFSQWISAQVVGPMESDVCGYCGRATDEPLNRYGVHDFCLYEREEQEEGEHDDHYC